MKDLRVGLQEFYPLVYKEEGEWKGFEVNLWEEIARRNAWEYTYEPESDLKQLIAKTEAGEFAVSLAGITRTSERQKRLDMSYLTLGTGLMLGVRGQHALNVLELCRRLLAPTVLRIFGIVAMFAVMIAHGYWIIERGASVSVGYIPGILESIWWAFVTFSTVGYGDIFPVTLLGKFYGVFAILIGLAIFGLFIAQLTASLTEQRQRSTINTIDDIAGKRIAVKRNTTAVHAVTSHGGTVVEFKSVHDAAQAVIAGSCEAVVADAPVLQGIKDLPGLFLVGGLFAHQSYSFILPTQSSLTKQINQTLIALQEDESFDQIYNKHFK